MVTFLKLLDPNVHLRAYSEDFSHAYKTVGIPIAQSKCATIVLAPPSGPPHFATLRTQPFGSSRAPANWARVTSFIQYVLKRAFSVAVCVYVGDVFAVEPLDTVESAHEAFTTLCELLGFALSEGKSQKPTTSIHLLGALVTFNSDHLTACLPPRRKDDLSNDIRQILSYNQLNPSQAAKLRGRLGFSQSLLFGKVGRALLQPITQRQYSRRVGRARPLTPELTDALQWWLAALESAPARPIPFSVVRPVLLYTDACGSGRVAAILIIDGVKRISRTHVPPRLADSEAGIFEYELIAVLLGLCVALFFAPGRPCLIFCDNMGYPPTPA